MDIKEIAMMITFGGSMLGIVGFVIGNTRSETEKRSRIYTRIDEVKKMNDETFVRKDICHTHHEYLDRTLKNIEGKLDKLLQPVSKGTNE